MRSAIEAGSPETKASAGSSTERGAGRPALATAAPVEFDGSIVHDGDVVVMGTGLRDVVARVENVASTDTPVLLEGETGSGKEVIARMIHARSRRASGPMIRVNCGAISPELVDSELFGHERGSFTGATSTRLGWFERADGGTLFLDEVAELSLAAQVRLLRVLQDGTLERVGSGRALKVDVRVVTATHRDLRAMCAVGAFREDLWYRISVFSVRIPPLRDRMQDVPALAAYFAHRAGVRLTGVPLVAKPEEVAALLDYPWPGNVRELAAVIERAAILGGGRRLEVAAALGDGRGMARAGVAGAGVAGAGAVSGLATATSTSTASALPFPTLDDATRAHIERALSLTSGRIEGRGGAADLLGLNPHTLRGKMRKLGLDWNAFRRGR
jgi:transcriptional regulator with GAF, ATPase, and Fis domain